MFHSSTEDRRQHTRFLVPGYAKLRVLPADYSGEVAAIVNVSGGGILLVTKASPPEKAKVEVEFSVQGYSGKVWTQGVVVRSSADLVGISFEGEAEGLPQLMAWLEAEMIGSFLKV